MNVDLKIQKKKTLTNLLIHEGVKYNFPYGLRHAPSAYSVYSPLGLVSWGCTTKLLFFYQKYYVIFHHSSNFALNRAKGRQIKNISAPLLSLGFPSLVLGVSVVIVYVNDQLGKLMVYGYITFTIYKPSTLTSQQKTHSLSLG